MKLNYRDKVILGIVLAVAILLGGFFGLVRPKSKKIKDHEATLATKEEERDQVQSKLDQIEPLKKKINEIYDNTTDMTDDFVDLDNISDEHLVDMYMQHFAEESEVEIKVLNVEPVDDMDLEYYYFETDVVGQNLIDGADLNGDMQAGLDASMAEQTALEERNVESVVATSYAIQVVGNREQIWAYMKALAEQDETILINSVEIGDYRFGSDPDNDVVAKEGEDISNVEFVVTLYSVFDMAKPNTDAP